MRQHRWLAAGLGVGLLFTTAASTTFAQDNNGQGNYGQDNSGQDDSWGCQRWGWCRHHNDDSDLGATPELDSLLLFGFGLTGLGGYAVTRYRARRRG